MNNRGKSVKGRTKVYGRYPQKLQGIPKTDDPLEFLRNLMNDERVDVRIRMRAALALKDEAGAVNGKLGKKQIASEKAERVASEGGQFAPTSLPLLRIVPPPVKK
jgi:hypothetical protein